MSYINSTTFETLSSAVYKDVNVHQLQTLWGTTCQSVSHSILCILVVIKIASCTSVLDTM